ncbi:MAG: Do family serine endopeptidase [Burkholderiaceae bacterium]
MQTRFIPSRTLISLAAAAILTVGLTTALVPVTAHARPAGPVLVQGLPDFTALVDVVGPSVVNIRTLEKASNVESDPTQGPDEQMLEFFRRFGIPIPPGMTPRGPRNERGPSEEAVPRGVGSGFVISADGYIMTNAHVVDGADEVLVTLDDKREFKAKIVGADRRSDVAVVKIEATGLPAVRFGDVSRLRVGEWVMAIGSPFGLENTVTAGIVSAKQRETGDFLPFIQTDVAINPGNSGGPLINMRGEVVGINSQIYSRSGGFQGISFAIPIDEAARVSEQLRTAGRVTRGRIGVRIDQVSKDVAESIGLGRPRGALVRAVEPDSPAAKAGVEPGDIILRFNGQDVERSVDLPRVVGNTAPGSRGAMTVFRRGNQRDLNVVVAEMEPDASAAAAGGAAPATPPAASGPARALGLSLADLTADQKRELGIQSGVRVAAVEGASARAGLREGDVIMAVANNETPNLKALEAVLAKLDLGKAVTVLLRRGEWAQYVVIRPTR